MKDHTPLAFLTVLILALSACGDASEPGGAGTSAPGIEAAPSSGPVEKAGFTTVLPVGWEILADDYDRMGLMTLAQQGTGGKQSIALKFEKIRYDRDPMDDVKRFADQQKGTPAESVTHNGIQWARTRIAYMGVEQTLYITGHDGTKVTFTVVGDDYETSPAVKAVFDALVLR
ncbi:MAG: hypothetical protein R3F61_08860 [Myxococcota bacterium]